MKKLFFAWIVAFIALVIISVINKGESTKFYGIAETMEIVVNSENSVVIKKIHVVQGQMISEGDTIIELDRPELTRQITEITHQINELTALKLANISSSRSQIELLKAQQATKINVIESEIIQLEAKYKLNKKLASQLQSINSDSRETDKNIINNPIKLKITSLKEELELVLNPSQLRIDRLKNQMWKDGTPVKIQVENLEDELKLLHEEKEKLTIFAQIEGRIGSVNFKELENVSPFKPIITMHTKSPSYIEGYIHENVYNKVFAGQKVLVSSLADRHNKTRGIVVGVGSRIVDYPERLRKRLDIPIWGREISIKISQNNAFLLGEKVLITSIEDMGNGKKTVVEKVFSKNTIKAYECDEGTYSDVIISKLRDVKLNKDLNLKKSIESSGLIYLDDVKKYIVISDDTEKKKPLLYVMNNSGIVEEEIKISGIKKIDDMEGIASGRDNELFIVTSQGVHSKNNKDDRFRKMLIRVKRDNLTFVLDNKVYLHKILKKFLVKKPASNCTKYIKSALENGTIDIEGLFYRDNSIYLGFKNPLRHNKAVILRFAECDDLFTLNNYPIKNITLWKEFEFKDKQNGLYAGISDLFIYGNVVYILSYAETEDDKQNKKRVGSLWCYGIEKNCYVFITRFENKKPEGIVYNPDKKEFVISFDNGSNKPFQIVTLKGLL